MITNRIFPKVILLFSSLLFCYSIVGAQSEEKIIDICPRVGNTIDRYEKDYFGLFPKIDDFDSAQVFMSADTHLYFRIHRFGFQKPDTLFPIKNFEFVSFGKFITEYEEVVQTDRDANST